MRITAALIPLVIMAAIGGAFAIGLGKDPHQLPSMMIDRPLPDFDLPTIRDGAPGFKRDDLKGQVAMINIFGSWCGSCRLEHPTLMRLARQASRRFTASTGRIRPKTALHGLKPMATLTCRSARIMTADLRSTLASLARRKLTLSIEQAASGTGKWARLLMMFGPIRSNR
ncbi:MAG: hypothetical protein R3C60_11490 [Parvularculaceae bacterium]